MVSKEAPASDLLTERGRTLATASLVPFLVTFLALVWLAFTMDEQGDGNGSGIWVIVPVEIATGTVVIAAMLLVAGHVLKTLADAEKLRRGSAPTKE